jgi:hypothetical protein
MWKMGSVNGMNISSTTHEMERAVSENIVSANNTRQLRGNRDQGSVETIRTSAEMPKK